MPVSVNVHFSELCNCTENVILELFLQINYSKIVTLWSSGQSSWLQIQRFGFDSRRYQIFRAVVSLERGPLSLVSTTEELLGRTSSGSGLESREYGRRDRCCWPRGTIYPQTLALSSPTRGDRSVGIVRSRTKTTEYFYIKKVRCIL
jgi:hypothetical protein